MVFWRQNRFGLMAVALALTLVGGETVAYSLPQCISLAGWAATLGGILTFSAFGWNKRILYMIAFFLFGLALAWRSDGERNETIRSHSAISSMSLEGKVYDVEVKSEPEVRSSRNEGEKYVSFHSEIGELPVKVIMPMRENSQMPTMGESWKCTGRLALKKSRIHRFCEHTLWVMNVGDAWKCEEMRTIPIGSWCRGLAKHFSDKLYRGVTWKPEIAGLNKAIVFGIKDSFNNEMRRNFSLAGTIHVFAISGLHVGMIAILLHLILSGLISSVKLEFVVFSVFLIWYVLMTGASPSAVRAGIMAEICMAAVVFNRKKEALNSWAVTVIGMYTFKPSLVFNIGSTLSFAVMLGLLLWIRWTENYANPFECIRKMAIFENEIGNGRKAARLFKWYGRISALSGSLGISVAAWIAGAPIVVTVFGNFTCGSLVVNLLVVPLAAMALFYGLIGSLLPSLFFPIAAFFNNMAVACTLSMELLSRLITRIPGASVEVGGVWKGWCVVWYVAWILLFAIVSRFLKQRETDSYGSWNFDREYI